MNANRRPTFQQIVEAAREASADRAWSRATAASRLRHALVARRRFRDARRCGEIKADALRRAVAVLPDAVRVGVDGDYQIGFVSVRWRGRGRFHLPPATSIGTPGALAASA